MENKRNTRCDNQTAEARTYQIMQKLMRGYTRAEIIDFTQNENWGLSVATIDMYIGKAKKSFHEELYANLDNERASAVARLTRLYRTCFDSGQLKTALLVQQELNKLIGMYNTDGTATGEVSDKNYNVIWGGNE